MGVYPYHRPDVAVYSGQRKRGPGRGDIVAHTEKSDNTGQPGAVKDFVPITSEGFVAQVAVGIEVDH